jgi:hypothetical protein
MQLFPRLIIMLLAFILTACGGSLDGSSTSDTDTDTDTTDLEVDSADPIVEEATGEPSYFTYEGVSSDWITIQGVGAVDTDEVATVSFKISDANRVGIEGEVVTFELINPPTGVTLTDTATSGEDGLVSTLISSGSAAGSIIVKVTLVSDTDIFKSSNALSISTGYPDQDGFTLAVADLSPEALNYIIDDQVTVYLGGGANNTAVPDGTVVTFSTDMGRITDEDANRDFCTTVGSECTMVWKSTNPKTAPYRATITAIADGEESYTDSNADGLYTDGEAFVDTNGDLKYTGMLCPKDVDYCVRELIKISDTAQILISGSSLFCDFTDSTGTTINQVDLTTASGSESVTLNVSVSDENNNAPPSDTEISAEIGNGELEGSKTTWNVPGLSGSSFTYSLILKRETELDETTTGNATFTMTTPKGLETSCSIPVIDDEAVDP